MGSANGTRKVLNCGIIGAGISGLAAAIALRRAGHQVEIFEKSTFKNEIGAAITLTSNAMLVLDKWGFDQHKAGATEKQQLRQLDMETLKLKAHVDFAGVRERFRGHGFAAFHRVDLHEEMRRMASELGVEVTLGKQAVSVDCEAGVIAFKDGVEVKEDLVITADGIKVGTCIKVLWLDHDELTASTEQLRYDRNRRGHPNKEDGQVSLPHPHPRGPPHGRPAHSTTLRRPTAGLLRV